ncbi:hypothetical protein WICMUC_004796 [Wickerhamomyces mucosus]|uniref:Spindle pole body component n=1 Tax=Wickerhamomyces mucosus TaxID=1378264 RepID=A0A9P8PGH2_9ASCO|nr:hypothetical protein WICMUC_004796 [Wickerhamomyces mucosus]
MSRDNVRVTELLANLVKLILPINELGSEYVESVYDEFLRQIETNHPTVNRQERTPDLNQLINQFDSKLPTNFAKNEFQQIIQQLFNYTSPSVIARYLMTFLNIVDSPIDNSSPINARYSRSNNNRIPISRHYGYDNMSVHGGFNDNRSIVSGFAGGFNNQDSFEHIDKLSDKRSVYSASRAEDSMKNYSFEEILIPYFENHIPDKRILDKIAYTLVGTTSDLFPLKDDEIYIPDIIPNSISGSLHALLEISLLYMKLTLSIENFKSQRLNSQIKTAFFSFITEQLNDYLKLVNELTTKPYSLKTLIADLYDELIRLRFLSFISKKSIEITGYQLLSFLFTYNNYGDFTIRDTTRKVINYCLQPFVSAINIWVVEGELNDRANEFFISYDTTNVQSHMDFSNRAKFSRERVPSFLSKEISETIYSIGITNHFLKFYCKETEWINEYSQKARFLLQTVIKSGTHLLDILRGLEFSKLISKLNSEILNYFTHIIHSKFHLLNVLNALTDFLLMRKGDFIEALMNRGQSLFNEPSSMLSTTQLSNLLRESVDKTTVRHYLNEDKHILNNLDARILNLGHGNIGWDVFTLDYTIETPLSFILNTQFNEHKREYLRIFNHLWKIKRLNYIFSEEWITNKNLKNRNKDQKFKRMKLIQNFFHNFIKTIEGYIFNEIIDVSYKSLVREISGENSKRKLEITRVGNGFKVPANSMKPDLSYLRDNDYDDNGFNKFENSQKELKIEELTNHHQQFLFSITKHKLIDRENEISRGKLSQEFYVTQLNNLINTAFKFSMTVKEFNILVSEESKSFKEYNDENSTKKKTVYRILLKLFNEFNSGLKVFVNDLTNDDDLELRYLGISLNQ